jgi:predicted nucleotidyltransferase
VAPKIAIDRAALAEFCRRHHVRRLALFGSVLRDDVGPESDVDVLVESQAQRASGQHHDGHGLRHGSSRFALGLLPRDLANLL